MTMAALGIVLSGLNAPGQQPGPDAPTFRTTSTLVFLDVTVLDKKGHPVVAGLNKEDFTITEDRKPQRIFSFEAPEVHVLPRDHGGENPDGKSPVTIFVLDLLDSEFRDFAYIRYSVRQFLLAQPAQLAAPAEMMVVGNESLEMLQGFTRNRDDLLYALDHLPPALPYKRMNGAFFWERFGQSIDALQQIALQAKGVPGRKNIVWVGHGGPNINLTAAFTAPQEQDLKRFVHATANMLVDSRVSLFVIYPGLSVDRPTFSLSAFDADADIGEHDPFAGDINFGVLVDETGGRLFYNRNDVDMLMQRSIRLGSNYYTLTYQPHDVPPDGKFRRIRVTLRDPNLRVLTKAGYFAPDKDQAADPRQKSLADLAEAAQSTIPFNALQVQITNLVRHPDTRTADLTLNFDVQNLDWLPGPDGKNQASVLVAVASRDANQTLLASRTEKLLIAQPLLPPGGHAGKTSHWAVTVRVPKRTKEIRVVMETETGGRMGSAEADRAMIDKAPTAPTPEPRLAPQRPLDGKPAAPPS